MMIYVHAWKLKDHIEEQFAPLCQQHGLNINDLHVLMTLYQQGDQMPSKLAEAAGFRPTSFTPLLDRLEQRGLIQRQKHPDDRRAILIVLTAAGEALRDPLVQTALKIEREVRDTILDWLPLESVE